jgi:hypothetical protein
MKNWMQKWKQSACLVAGLLAAGWVWAAPIPVTVESVPGGYVLLRGGERYTVKGAGGTEQLNLLAASGANSVRTWGPPSIRFLDRAHALGLSVCVGFWVDHERHGFDYNDDEAVAAQIARHKTAIDQLKDHPAVLVWAIGNEVELEAKNMRVWDVVEEVAAYAKKMDPHRPTMTIIAHAPEKAVQEINKRCPSIDILGTNSYGGVGGVGQALRDAGWDGPFLVTEWGVNGPWEQRKTDWGAEIEATSTEKARQVGRRYARMQQDPHNLGNYIFFWGAKQETTATWFNLFLDDGRRLESVEVLDFIWSGTWPRHLAPRAEDLTINGMHGLENIRLKAGAAAVADFALTRGDSKGTKVHWEIVAESDDKRTGGDAEEVPDTVAFDTRGAGKTHLDFVVPEQAGAYRLFLYVYGKGRTAATANIPFYVEAE